jgi:ribonuclease HI
MAKFYDTLRPEVVMERALAMGFPLRTLVLGMMTHQAARSLRAGEAYSEAILPAKSILAGCGLSVSWTRAVLFSMLEAAHRRYPVEHYFIDSWVDDLSSVIQGTAQMCEDIAVETGKQLAASCRDLGLVISDKSKVLFNRPGAAKQVALRLQAEGIFVSASTITKDLGIGTAAGGTRRHTSVMKARRSSMAKRLSRIRVLVRQDRRCRTLIWTGAKPQGTWGHQGVGLAPTAILQIRRQFAAAAMIRRSGGCTTTAFALTVGPDSDPMVSIRVELLQCWLQVASTTTVQPVALEKVWCKQAKTLAGPLRWGKVKGPMGAVIATLMDLGWQPEGPTRWGDPQGNRWQIDPRRAGVIPLVLAKIRQSCTSLVWRKANEHYCGQGIGEAADLTALQQVRRACIKQGSWKDAALIDMVAQGACWPPARRAALGEGISSECQFCRQGVEGTLRHQAWQCPVILAGIGAAREEARHLEAAALGPALDEVVGRARWSEGVPPPNCEAFWCRGILPRAGSGPLKDLLEAPPVEPVASGHAAPLGNLKLTAEMGPLITIGSDGSGGEHGSDTRLRRVGWSWVALSPEGQVLGSVHGGIEADFAQTVPRAELHAVIHFLRHVEILEGVSVEVHIDNAYVVNSFHQFVAGWRPTPRTLHGDLWADLVEDTRGFEYVLSGRVKAFKVKAHLSLQEALARGHSKLAWLANKMADELADKGARSSAFSAGDVQLVCRLDTAALLVVRRLHAVARYVVEHREPPVKTTRAVHVPLRRRVEAAGRQAGHILYFSAGVGCKQCRSRSRMRTALATWAVKPCPGPGSQHGHRMQTVHGLWFCTVCGRWAIATGAGSRGIHQQCPGFAAKRGGELLSRMACNPPKLPDLHGRKLWPDGTPPAPPAALAAAGRRRRAAGVPPSTPASSSSTRAGGAARGQPRPPLLFRPRGADKEPSPAEQRLAAVYARVRSRAGEALHSAVRRSLC